MFQSLTKPPSISVPSPKPFKSHQCCCCPTYRIRSEALDSSKLDLRPFSNKNNDSWSSSSAAELLESSAMKKGPYPGGMGPYTGRDPNLKKPGWLRQRAPQGERFQEVKESLSRLNLNTVCEEAQCPNIGEVNSI